MAVYPAGPLTTSMAAVKPRAAEFEGRVTNRVHLKQISVGIGLVCGLVGCADLSPGTQRMVTGTMIGAGSGAAIGAIAGNAGMGAGIGAAAGLLGGYLYDQHEKAKQQAYQQGYAQGQQQARKPNPPWQ